MLSWDDARALTEEIKINLGVTWELVVTAYTGQAWRALGYVSWGAYCAAELDTQCVRLPREKRMTTVAKLHESGMSIRAIAAATGAAYNTVLSDVTQIESPDTTLGIDGKNYPRPPKPPKPAPSLKHLLAALDRAVAALEDRLDGKPVIPTDAAAILGDLAIRVAQLEERVMRREDASGVIRVPIGESLILVPVDAGLCPDCGKATGHEKSCPTK